MSKRRLLLADDSITIQKVVNLTFADEGIDVITFGDGDAALEKMEEVRPDIVLADVHMPGLNGYQVCELVRQNEGTKHIPVVLLVGTFEPFDKEEAARVGADRYLTKPFSSIAELVATVNGLLDQPSVATETEQPGATEKPDTSDIESLYQQSFIETAEFSPPENFDIEFGDDGDDEMIQTSHADSDIDSLANASFFDDDDTFDDLDPGSVTPIYDDAWPRAEQESERAPAATETERSETSSSSEPDDHRDSPTEFVAEPPAKPIEPPAESLNGGSSDTYDWERTTAETEPAAAPKGVSLAFDDSDLLELPAGPRRRRHIISALKSRQAKQEDVLRLSRFRPN